MKVVLDTNTVISALIWTGSPHQILTLKTTHNLSFFTSPFLLNEFDRVLHYPKIIKTLAKRSLEPADLLFAYLSITHLINPSDLPDVSRDSDDNHVLACALEAKADLIVSGDDDLLCLQSFQSIPIKNASDAFVLIQHQEPSKR
jgi:putative PIN family toxin of toxin-antitoxin system